MWFSANVKEARKHWQLPVSPPPRLQRRRARVAACARDGRGGAERRRARARARGGAEGPASARARGCPVGRRRCAPTRRSACPRVLSAAVRLEQPPNSAWRHFEAERRRNGRAGCGRGGGGGGGWMRRRRRIPESSGVRGVASRPPGGRKQFS